MMSLIGVIHFSYSFWIYFSSIRLNPMALSKVSSIECMLSNFAPKVACMLYFVAVSSCSCNVSVWFFSASFIYTVCTSVFSLLLSPFRVLHHAVPLTLSLGCRRISVRFPSRSVSLYFIVFRISGCVSLWVSIALTMSWSGRLGWSCVRHRYWSLSHILVEMSYFDNRICTMFWCRVGWLDILMGRVWWLVLEIIRILGDCQNFLCATFCLVRTRLSFVEFSMLTPFQKVYIVAVE